MNNGNLREQWSELRRPIKNHWSQLTEQDLKEISGKLDLLMDKLQERYGYTKAEAERKVDQFIHRIEPQLKNMRKRIGSNLVHIGSNINATVKRSPWTLALTTGLTGIILGFALNRKRMVSALFGSKRRWF
jgi:uncharacterized protein YjbJ (UPF0337 family)